MDVESVGTIRAGCWTGDAWAFELGWQPWAKKRPQISRGGRRTHQPPDDAAAEASTREALLSLFDRPPLTGNLELSLVFYRQSRQVVDLDNLIKHICDSANGVLWVDDRQITAFASVRLMLDRTHPRTIGSVRPDRLSNLTR